MNPLCVLFSTVASLVAALAIPGAVFAAEPASAQPASAMQAPMCDPCVPPTLRNSQPAPQTEGAALQTQVERKLRKSFDAADTAHAGAITREQARAAGLGVVANNFDRIDRTGSGKVTFEDVKQYLRERGGKL